MLGRDVANIFILKIVNAILYFGSTLIVARIIGAEELGQFFLFIAIVMIATTIADAGLIEATKKRVSEDEDMDSFFSAALYMRIGLLVFLSVFLFLFAPQIRSYIGVDNVVPFLIIITFLSIMKNTIKATLIGEFRVVLSEFIDTLHQLIKTVLWVILLLFGFGFYGLIYGVICAYLLSGIVGFVLLSSNITVPQKRHFVSLIEFSKYSSMIVVAKNLWNWTDVAILGFFVSSTLVAIYEISWQVSVLFYFSSVSISQAMFPTVSNYHHNDQLDEARSIVNKSLSYSTILIIPGIFGGLIIGQGVLGIYGTEFTIGHTVLIILITARLFHCVYQIAVSALNAFNIPKYGFIAATLLFISNTVLNVIFVYYIGWTGAAIATLTSIALATILAIYYLSKVIKPEVDTKFIGCQIISGVIMASLIIPIEVYLETNIISTIVIIIIGSAIYFISLYMISERLQQDLGNRIPDFI